MSKSWFQLNDKEELRLLKEQEIKDEEEKRCEEDYRGVIKRLKDYNERCLVAEQIYINMLKKSKYDGCSFFINSKSFIYWMDLLKLNENTDLWIKEHKRKFPLFYNTSD
jgi:hypothetical protein